MAGEGLGSPGSTSTQAEKEQSQKYPCGEHRETPGLARSFLCSMAALTHAGRTHGLLLAQEFALLIQPGMQELKLFGDYFSRHPATAANDYQHLHDRCRRACCQSHSPTNHSRSVWLKKEQRRVMGSGALSLGSVCHGCSVPAAKTDGRSFSTTAAAEQQPPRGAAMKTCTYKG